MDGINENRNENEGKKKSQRRETANRYEIGSFEKKLSGQMKDDESQRSNR